jgi:hypothetical protein
MSENSIFSSFFGDDSKMGSAIFLPFIVQMLQQKKLIIIIIIVFIWKHVEIIMIVVRGKFVGLL